MRSPQEIREEQGSLHFKFLEKLLQWHGGMGTGVYAVGSTWLAKKPVPSCEVERALGELRQCVEDPRLDMEERQEAFEVRETLMQTALQEGMLVNVRKADTPHNTELRAKLAEIIQRERPEEWEDDMSGLCSDLAGILAENTNENGIDAQLEFLLSNGVSDGQILDNLGIREAQVRPPEEPQEPADAE